MYAMRIYTQTAKAKLHSTNIENHYFVKVYFLGQVHNKIGGSKKIVYYFDCTIIYCIASKQTKNNDQTN